MLTRARRAVAITVLSAAPVAAQTPSPADVRFIQRMIGHHAQAVTMTALVPARSGSADIRLIAGRISVSQQDEMAWMRRWLTDHHQPLPDTAMAHSEHAGMDMSSHPGMDMSTQVPLMPGMLTSEELARLAATTGSAFDQLFLQYMIRHHEGALTMVAELLGTAGAAQDPAIFAFASEVDADQRAEIARMRARLTGSPSPTDSLRR